MGKGQGMKQLSGLDASFLYLETPEMPMHVGALHVFELEKGFRGDFVRRMREHLRTRLLNADVEQALALRSFCDVL